MNNFIAKAHRIQRKFLGVIVASGSLLAFILSFILIIAGIEVTALMRPPTTNLWGLVPYAIVWVVAGSLIAVLIERLTLTNCAKYRIIREKVELINEKFSLIENPTEDTKKEHQKDIKKAQKGRPSTTLLIAMGTGLSMLGESLIIHFLFGNFEVYLGWAASLFLSGLVSYTLISSELHKGLDAEVLHESLNADTFLAIAARANVTDHVNQQVLAKSTTKVEEIANSDVIASAIDQAVVADVDDVMEGNGRIILRIDNEREQKRMQIAHEKELTRQQLSLVRGVDNAADIESDTEPLTISREGIADSRPKSRSYLEAEELYSKYGDAYFTASRKRNLARKYGVEARTIDRHLARIKEIALLESRGIL